MPHTRRRRLRAGVIPIVLILLALAPGVGRNVTAAGPGTLAKPADIRGAQVQLAPMHLPRLEARIQVGRYLAVPRPIHIRPGAGERAVVRSLLNMYQLDQRFANLFAPDGKSNICGAASTANGLIYMRRTRQPAFPLIMRYSVPDGSINADVVSAAFKHCGVDRTWGTKSERIVGCAKGFVAEGGYPTDWIWRVGVFAEPGRQRRAPQPTELREYIDRDRAVVLLFGWYTVEWKADTKLWTYVRGGGHFVALAGYDANELTRIYVSNPLVDYNAPGFGEARESALRLSAVPLTAQVAPPEGVRGLWQTTDLVGGGLAVLEEAVVIGTR